MCFVQLSEYVYVNELDTWAGTFSSLGAFIYYQAEKLPCFEEDPVLVLRSCASRPEPFHEWQH